jgi:heterodisulfide reductase subunit C
LKIGAEHGLFNCVVCQNCNEVCPKEVDPADIIMELQNRVIGTDVSNRAVRKVKAWTDSVRKTGKAEGMGIRFKTKGLSILLDVRQAIRLAMKGKLPWPFLKPVREIDAIRDIFRQCKDSSK